jgi:sulfide:quinone oxidoreductase
MNPTNVVIAGGGVAGLEALLALHAQAGPRVRLTLIAPDPDFSYRPMAVAEPFSLGRAERVPLARFAEETGAELVQDAVIGVDDAAGEVRLRGGGTRRFDALLVAPGGRAVSGVPGATTWWPGGDADTYGGLLRDLEEGYSKRLAIVVPPGAVWPLPAYELALMTAGEARAMGQDDVQVTVVTPEHEPLTLFGDRASDAVADELDAAGIALETGAVGRVTPGGLTLEPEGRILAVQRVFAVPRVVGPALDGLPADEEGFIRR